METGVIVVNLPPSESKIDSLPNLENCCFVFNLKRGLCTWLVIEAFIWAFLFVAALFHEIFYVNVEDLLQFSLEMEGWYFYIIFGGPVEYLSRRIYSKSLIDFRVCYNFNHAILFLLSLCCDH